MSFSLEIMRSWVNGSVLSGAEDMIPPQALRVALNVRLDRVRGLIVSRPGTVQLTSGAVDAVRPDVLMHTKLYGESADWGYVQVAGGNGALYRTSTTWQTPVPLYEGYLPATQVLSNTNWVDGYTHPWKYFIGAGLARKDNGTSFLPWGMTGPSEAPSAASASSSTITGGGNVSLGAQDVIATNATPPSPHHVPANGAGYFQVYHGQALTGTHNGLPGSATLVDTTRDFAALGCVPGWFVQGWHGGDAATGTRFGGRISGATTTTLESISGWGGHLWEPGDRYQVLINMALGSEQVGVSTATGGTDTTLNHNGQDFVEAGVQVGMYCYNLTTGGGGRITELRTTSTANDTLVLANGFLAEPGLVDPTRGTTLAGDAYMVYNTLSSQSDVITMELYAAPGTRLTRASVFLGLSPRLGAGDGLQPEVTVAAQKTVTAAQFSGTPPWYQINLKKGEFEIPTSSPEPFQAIGSYVASVEASSEPGGLDMSLGAVSMTRGSGAPQQIAVRYTVTYMVSSTGEETSPPKTTEQVVLYSNTLTLERQLVRLDLSRIARAPEAGGIDKIAIYRQKEGEALAYLVTTVPSDTTTYLDTVADEHLNINHPLEPDNDPPPPDGVVLFGPGAQQRLFMIRDRNKLCFSKHWEYHKDRASNWPFSFELQIGDGSQEALNGLMTDQSIFVWSEDQTWQILGQGENAYVPLPVPLSHGLLARWCLCSGDGRIFFLAKDGIYQQQGLTQQKISGDLDPFFSEEIVHGILPLSRDAGALARCQMAWYPHPTEPEIVLLYAALGDTAPSRRLVLKKNPQTQQYTDAFFDDSLPKTMQSVYSDPQALTLTFGTGDSHIWQSEVATATTDVGQAIAGRVRLPSRDQSVPRVVKTYSDIVVEANTGGTPVTVQAAFNRSTEVVTAGTVTTSADNVMVELPLAQTSPPAQLRRHHLGLDLAWSSTNRITITQLGWHAQLEAEDLTFLDTGPLVFDSQTTLRRIHFTYDATTTVTAQVTVDGVALAAFVLPATSRRTRYDQVISLPPALTRGKIFRLTLTSAAPCLVYAAIGEFEPEPLPITAWDSRDVTFDTPQILRQLLFDIEAPGAAVTAILYIDGVQQETWTLGPTVGRDRINYVTTSGAATMRGDVFRLTLTSTAPFQLWGLEGVFESQPLQTTFWDSREVTFESPQVLHQLFFDIDAPAAVTVKVYVDGVLRETFVIGPTNGRERIQHVFSTTDPVLKGQTFRVTMESTQPFTVWSVSAQLEDEPIATTFYDTRNIPFVLVHAIKWYALDLDAPSGATLTTHINGVVRDTRTVPATTGRQRVNVWLPAGIKGRALRATLNGATALQVWGWSALTKALGQSQGYTPTACLESIQKFQEKTFMEAERRTSNKPLVQIDQQRQERPFLQVGEGMGNRG